MFIQFIERASKFHEEHLKQAINSNQLHQLLANSITFQSRDLPKSSMSYDELTICVESFYYLPRQLVRERLTSIRVQIKIMVLQHERVCLVCVSTSQSF